MKNSIVEKVTMNQFKKIREEVPEENIPMAMWDRAEKFLKSLFFLFQDEKIFDVNIFPNSPIMGWGIFISIRPTSKLLIEVMFKRGNTPEIIMCHEAEMETDDEILKYIQKAYEVKKVLS